MFSAEAMRYMNEEQKRRISLLGVQARELKRMALDPPEYPPIPEGLQLAALFLDFRFGDARSHHALLFQASDYKNRYRWIRNNNMQNGLIGWHDAVRTTASNVRPIPAGFYG